MHFVGMAAVTLDHTPICFGWNKTIGSLGAAIVFMSIAVLVASTDIFATQDRVQVLKMVIQQRRGMENMNGPTRRRSSKNHKKNQKTKNMREILWVIAVQQLHPLIIASAVAATGALVMHYTGMMALHGPFHKKFDVHVILASIVMAIIVFFAGFLDHLSSPLEGQGIVASVLECSYHFYGRLLLALYWYDRSPLHL